MNVRHTGLGSLTLTLLLVLAGCGGGGGSSTPPVVNPPPTNGIDRGGIAVGPIGGFGSIIVNGVRFDTSAAAFTVNGSPGSQSDLSVGQVVAVLGTFDDNGLTGVATSVEFDDAVKGPIEGGSIDLPTGTFRVLGQTIKVTNATIFDDSIQPPAFAGLADGDLVEVSGLPDASGRIVATRIEAESPGSEFEITGLVSALDAGASTFRINSLTVDFSAAQLDDFPGGQISEGDLVEAQGSQFSNGELLATQVEYRGDVVNDDDLEVGDEIEIEGIITVFNSSSDFSISGLRVLTDAGTSYEGGSAADLGLNVRVEVEGDFEGNGTLRADEIKFEPDAELRVSGLVEATNAVAGTFQVLGLEIGVKPETSFEDDLNDQQIFGLADLRIGDYVEVDGYTDAGDFVASQVARDDPEDDSSVRGYAADLSAPTLTVLGVPAITDTQTEFENDDTPITADDFFATADGRLVDARGIWDGSSLTVERIEIENEGELDDD